MKRVKHIVLSILVVLLVIAGSITIVLASGKIQTAIAHRVAYQLSQKMETDVQIESVKYYFPARVVARGIYIEDKQQDTLAYIDNLYVHFRPLALLNDEIRFSHVHVRDVVAKLYKVGEDGEWNYRFLVDAFATDQEEENKPMEKSISVKDIQLDGVRVQYEDYLAQLPHAELDLHQLSETELDAEIASLALQIVQQTENQTNQPFVVEDMKARFLLNDTVLSLPTLEARLPESRLDLSGVEVRFPEGDTLYLSQSAHEILFDLNFHEARLVPSDLALFVPRLKTMNRPVTLNGAFGGTLDSVYFHNISLGYDGYPVLTGDVSAVGLPYLEKTYLRANLKDLHLNAVRLEDFLSRLQGRPIRLPKPVHRLGDIHYRGLAQGRLHDLTLRGGFYTALGDITTDGTFESDTTFSHMNFDALIAGERFGLGEMLAQDKLGSVTLDFYAKGQIDDGQVRCDINAWLRELSYNGYTYNDLHVDGRYEPQRYNGSCSIDDPHLAASFEGVVDLRDKNPEINFNLRCRHFDMSPLSENHESKVRTSFAMAVDLNGAKADEISGYLVIDSLFFANSRDSVLISQMKLLASASQDRSKQITLRSDNLRAQLDGVFRYSDLVPAVQDMMHYYLPSVVDASAEPWLPVSLSMKAEGDRLRDVQRLFESSFTLSDHSTLHAGARLEQGETPAFHMKFFAPGLRAANTPIHDLSLSLNTVDTLRPDGVTSGLKLSLSAEAKGAHTKFSTVAFRDSLLTHISFDRPEQENELLPEGWENLSIYELSKALSDNLTSQERFKALVAAQRAGDYGGDIHFITHFSKYNAKPLIDMHFLPGTVLLRDSLYTLSDSRMTWCSDETSLRIEHFAFEGGGQHIRANGLASKQRTDTLNVDLQRIDAAYVVPFVLPEQTIMFNGLMTGQADITSVFEQPLVETQIHVDSMGLNNCWFGDAEVDLYVYPSRKIMEKVLPPQLQFHAEVDRPERHVVSLDGNAIFDGSGKWELDMDVDSVPLDFINHWTYTVLKDLDGHGSGRVVVGGRKGFVYVLLQTVAHNASLTLPWTDARYTIARDSILMDTTAILFPNVHLTDAYGNPVVVNGGVHHRQFKNFRLDIHVDAKDALVYNMNNQGDMLQGTVFATGHVDVTGGEQNILVAADARTSKNSKFRLSIDKASSAYESDFIHFVQHPEAADSIEVAENDLDNIDIDTRVARVDSAAFKRAGRCLLKLNLDVNPNLLFQLVLGERNGDMIKARGNGALRLTYDTKTSDVTLLGTYDIEQGSLSYTAANVIRKEFAIGNGSTIVFSGDATNPQLDVTAKYRVTASLRDLFGDDAELTSSRTNIPVLTCLHMTGPLNNPLLTFSLEFPLSDQAVQQQVRQVINTDEMMMRQVIYLLVFGRFFTPDYMSNAQFATLNSTYSLLSSTVTGQINAWLSKLTNMLTVGVAIRTDGEGSNSRQEYEAQFQLQPVDRLVINGNVGYRYNDISNQPFFGDLDVEVLLTEDGQWRLKGYTHTVDKYSLRQASTIQGVGFVWKKDF